MFNINLLSRGGCRCFDRKVVGYTTSMQSVPITAKVVSLNLLMRGVVITALCDKLCQLLAAGWYSGFLRQ